MNVSNVGDGVATAAAEAVTSFQPASCELDSDFELPEDEPTPTPGPTPNPTPPPPPPEPDDIETTVDCGFGGLAVIFRFPEERFYFVDLASALDDRDPRLTRDLSETQRARLAEFLTSR